MKDNLLELIKLLSQEKNNPYKLINPFSVAKKKIIEFYLKNKTKIILTIVVLTSIIITLNIIYSEKRGLFLITDYNGYEYNTNEYKIKNECVTFTRNKGIDVTLCGNFKIEKTTKK